MDDNQILQRGGDENDIAKESEANGADLTKEDFMPTNNQEKKPFVDFNDLPVTKIGDGSKVQMFVFGNKKLKKSKRVTPFNRKRI